MAGLAVLLEQESTGLYREPYINELIQFIKSFKLIYALTLCD